MNLLGTTAIIRPSSLPGFQDCERRTAARLFRPLIEAAGYRLRRLQPSVGAAIGSGVHAGAAAMLRVKLAGNEISGATVAETTEQAEHEFTARVEREGAIWDDVTPRKDTAQRQIERMVRQFKEEIAPTIDPIAVEERFYGNLGDNFTLSGQSDSIARTPDDLNDLKTGKSRRLNGAQYGAYSLLLRGHGFSITGINEHYVPRAALTKPQPPAEIIKYDVAIAEHTALDLIDAVKRAVAEFIKRATSGVRPPEGAFIANPNSYLCGDKWCEAWGTAFCRLHKGAK